MVAAGTGASGTRIGEVSMFTSGSTLLAIVARKNSAANLAASGLAGKVGFLRPRGRVGHLDGHVETAQGTKVPGHLVFVTSNPCPFKERVASCVQDVFAGLCCSNTEALPEMCVAGEALRSMLGFGLRGHEQVEPFAFAVVHQAYALAVCAARRDLYHKGCKKHGTPPNLEACHGSEVLCV